MQEKTLYLVLPNEQRIQLLKIKAEMQKQDTQKNYTITETIRKVLQDWLDDYAEQ